MNNEALYHFKKIDPTLYKFAVKIKLDPVINQEDYFINLVELIISQQLSGKAAETIFKRFKKIFKNTQINPKEVLEIPDQKIRECGISFSKVKYIKNLAQTVLNKEIDLNKLECLSDTEVINCLVKLNGIGRWTAEMFLMFSLNRKDVFSSGDLGIQNAIKKIYKLETKPNKEKLIEISSKWSPYRTYASRILWKSLEK